MKKKKKKKRPSVFGRGDLISGGDQVMLIVDVKDYNLLNACLNIEAPRLECFGYVRKGSEFNPEIKIGAESVLAVKKSGADRWIRKPFKGGSADLSLRKKLKRKRRGEPK